MSAYALKIPADGEPQVLVDDTWGFLAICAVLGRPITSRITVLRLRGHLLRAYWRDVEGLPDNAHVAALFGRRDRRDRGDLLLVKHHIHTLAPVSLGAVDLLTIGSQLLLGEELGRQIEGGT